MTAPTRSVDLSALHDIVVPEPVAWWPQTPAWAALGVALVAVAVALAFHRRRVAARNRYRGEALAELDRIAARLADDADRARAIVELPVLLKRVALEVAPREEVASLTGDAWLAFLDARARRPEFRDGPGRPIAELTYASPRQLAAVSAAEAEALAAVTRRWIEGHRAGAR